MSTLPHSLDIILMLLKVTALISVLEPCLVLSYSSPEQAALSDKVPESLFDISEMETECTAMYGSHEKM